MINGDLFAGSPFFVTRFAMLQMGGDKMSFEIKKF
jgi:hypothetical protein